MSNVFVAALLSMNATNEYRARGQATAIISYSYETAKEKQIFELKKKRKRAIEQTNRRAANI